MGDCNDVREYPREMFVDGETGDKAYERMNAYVEKLNENDQAGRTKPPQYSVGMDTIERCKQNLTPNEIVAICKFNIDKYTWRKKGQDESDMVKVKDYADLMLWAIKQGGKK